MSKLSFWERKAIADKAYRPSDNSKAIDVRRLRLDMFHDGRIPLNAEGWEHLKVYNTHGELIGDCEIRVDKSKSVGERKCRGGRGHRLFITCPACASADNPKGVIYNPIPVGRLHQHYGYKHCK